jgi:hypothetical protein
VTSIIEWGKVAAAVGAMIALASGIAGLIFLAKPNWAPWTTFRADLSETGMEHNVRVEKFEQRGYANGAQRTCREV